MTLVDQSTAPWHLVAQLPDQFVEPSSLGLRLLRVKLKTEKTRLRRSLLSLQDLMRRIRHLTIPDQAGDLNAVLRGHYAYYGIAGNIRALQKVYRALLAEDAVQP